MLDLEGIGNRIKSLRLSINNSQDELATTLFVTRQAVSSWEKGKSLPSIDTIIELSKLFNISIDSLLLLDNSFTNLDEYFMYHTRTYILNLISINKVPFNIVSNFYRFNKTERYSILTFLLNRNMEDINIKDLLDVLNEEERHFLMKKINSKGIKLWE